MRDAEICGAPEKIVPNHKLWEVGDSLETAGPHRNRLAVMISTTAVPTAAKRKNDHCISRLIFCGGSSVGSGANSLGLQTCRPMLKRPSGRRCERTTSYMQVLEPTVTFGSRRMNFCPMMRPSSC